MSFNAIFIVANVNLTYLILLWFTVIQIFILIRIVLINTLTPPLIYVLLVGKTKWVIIQLNVLFNVSINTY